MNAIIYIHLLLFFSSSCGNADEDASSCRSYIDSESWDEAIECYESGDYSESPSSGLDSEDYLYLLQWSGAYGGKYGLVGAQIIDGFVGSDDENPIDFASKTESLNEAGSLSSAITDIQKAISLILAYPEELRTEDHPDAVYYASEISLVGLVYTSFLAELQKKDFENSLASGELTTDQLIDKAEDLLQTLRNGGDIVADPELSATIDEQLSQIDSQEGSNSAEKLEEFLNESE